MPWMGEYLNPEYAVLYICDHRACGDSCSFPTCKHTPNIRHARNFELSNVSVVGDPPTFIEQGDDDVPQYTNKRNHRTCNYCGANLDHGESCDCQKPEIATSTSNNDESLLNRHGKYVMKFAETHGISIAEAHEHPMVKAHLEAYNVFKDLGLFKETT